MLPGWNKIDPHSPYDNAQRIAHDTDTSQNWKLTEQKRVRKGGG